MVSDRTVVIVAGLGAVAVAGVAYWRWRTAEAERAADAAKDPCELLRLAGAGDAEVAACKAGKAVVGELIDLVDGALDALVSGQVKDWRAANVAANGAVVDENPLRISKEFFEAHQNWPFYAQTMGPDGATRITSVSMMRGCPVLHENGCIPAPGARLSADKGWHKCAPETRSYVALDEAVPWKLGEDRWLMSGYRRCYTGQYQKPEFSNDSLRQYRQILDPTTHPHIRVGGNSGSRRDQPFPLAHSAEQEPWWVCGRAFVAPAMGLQPVVVFRADAAGDQRPVEVSFEPIPDPGNPLPPPPALPPGQEQPPVGQPTDQPDPNMVWVPPDNSVSPPMPGYWRRRRAKDLI